MTIDQAFAESIAKDREDIVNYWSRVIKRTGTTDETISESIKYVNETYYKPTKLYKALNEAVYSYDAVKDGNGFSHFGVAINSKQLISKLKTNIREQISGPLGGHSDYNIIKATLCPVIVFMFFGKYFQNYRYTFKRC